jgi:hypothetical protein
MIKNFLVVLVCFFTVFSSQAQTNTVSENVVLITLDGMRWQEVFGGVDTALVNSKQFTLNPNEVTRKFYDSLITNRRSKLFPFLWSTIANQGVILGNRWRGSLVNNANKYWFSYPGYNELLTGYPDSNMNTNDKIWNPNENVLEFINKKQAFKGKVAAFTSWDVFPYILNVKRNGLYVNSDKDSLRFTDANLQLVNSMQFIAPEPLGLRQDVFTYFAAREYLKTYKPKFLYIAFDETDDFAHGGMYDQYLKSAHAEDAMIADLWNIIQTTPEYKNKTTLIITCDHGRGDKIKETWKHHGSNIEDAGQIWIAALGPSIKPLGELTNQTQVIYQKQIAATIAKLLGFEFITNHPVASPIQFILK